MTNRTLYAIDLFLNTRLGRYTQFILSVLATISLYGILLLTNIYVVVYTIRYIWTNTDEFVSHVLMMSIQMVWMCFTIIADIAIVLMILDERHMKIFYPKQYCASPDSYCHVTTMQVITFILVAHFGHLIFVGVQLLNQFLLASDFCTQYCPLRGSYGLEEGQAYAYHGMLSLLLLELICGLAMYGLIANLVVLKSLIMESYEHVSKGLDEFDKSIVIKKET